MCVRLFIAIPFDESVKQQLAELQQGLIKSRTRMKLVEKDNMHMTLRFIGDSEPQEWIKKIDSITEKPFDLLFDRVGAFPSLQKINVVWAGCSAPQSLLNIHRVIGERELTPHVTLARVKGKPDQALRAFLSTQIRIQARAERIQLINSALSANGPAYEVVHEKNL